MITDKEAREAVENIVLSTRVLDKYCKDHDCADCWFRGEYDEFTEEYVCDIRDLLDVRWYK